MNQKRSFFERLSGSVAVPEDYGSFDDDAPMTPPPTKTRPVVAPLSERLSGKSSPTIPAPKQGNALSEHEIDEGPVAEGQLPVDVYQTPNEIVIRAFVAGVRADEVSVSISRDMVVIEGAREERERISESDYFTRELFWGTFARTVLLPEEIDVENSSAASRDGLLTLILPKLDKAKQTKLKVKAG